MITKTEELLDENIEKCLDEFARSIDDQERKTRLKEASELCRLKNESLRLEADVVDKEFRRCDDLEIKQKELEIKEKSLELERKKNKWPKSDTILTVGFGGLVLLSSVYLETHEYLIPKKIDMLLKKFI